jgi:hypothetical protein
MPVNDALICLQSPLDLGKETHITSPTAASKTKAKMIVMRRMFLLPTTQVNDGSQAPMTCDSSLSESVGSRSLHRLVRLSVVSPDHSRPRRYCP